MITDGAVTGQSSTPLSVDLLTQEEERHMAAVDGSLFCLTSEEWKEKAIAGQRRTGESEEVVWSNIVREHVKEVLEREGRKAVDERGHHGRPVLHWALMMKTGGDYDAEDMDKGGPRDLAREKGKNRNDDIPNAPTFPTTTTTSQDQQPRIERPKSPAGSMTVSSKPRTADMF
ncbi:hypothetical protein BC829DRAFT_419792 [Chytridium lagenaria]|nr:hypothetical protein BC829DRAFT_419792 [Chytridium lagenaria]